MELIAGPCSAENPNQLLSVAKELSQIDISYFRCGLWKPRTSPGGFEGVGAKGLDWLNQVQKQYGLKVATEVASPKHVEQCLKHSIDALWIGARTTTNPFSIQEIAQSLKGTDIPVFVKNPLNPDINLWIGAIERLSNAGLKHISAVHRGFSFADNGIYRQTPYWKEAVQLKVHYPQMRVLCDPSHIAGKRELVAQVALQAIQLGLDGLMIEVHCNPKEALTDALQQLCPQEFISLIESIKSSQSHNTDPSLLLGELRKEIDVVDCQIINLLQQRMNISSNISTIKKENNISLLQISRFQQMMQDRLAQAKAQDLNPKLIEDIFELIHSESLRIQNKDTKD